MSRSVRTDEHAGQDQRFVGRRDFLAISAAGLVSLLGGLDAFLAHADEPGASAETLAALDSAQAAYEDAMAQLASLNEQVEMAQYELSQTQAALDATNASIAELEASIAQTQAELEGAQDVLAERLAANYKVGKVDVLSAIFDAEDFDDLVNRIYYAGKVSDADAQAIQDVKDLKAQLEQQQADLESTKAEQEQLLAQQQEETQALQDQVGAMQSYADGLSQEVTELMAQAQREAEAAREAQYQAYLEQQQAAQQQAGGESGAVSGGDASGGAGTGDGGGSQGGGEYYPTEGGSGDWGSSGGGTGNHAGDVVSVAWNYVGVTPYVWGGTDPSGFDCSGLAQYCYAACGYSIARDTYGQIAQIQSLGNWRTDLSQLSPGDLVFPHSGHVGIYCGGGMMIHAPYEGQLVTYASVYAFMGGGSPI